MRTFLKYFTAGFVALTLGLSGFTSANAAQTKKKLDPNIKPLIVCGLYGAVVGSVVGLITAPVASDLKSIFVGTSVGLYMGVAIGIAYAATRPAKRPQAFESQADENLVLSQIQSERAGRVSPSSPLPLSFQFQLTEF